MTGVYKIELLVIDHDGLGPAAVKDALECARYANHCISPTVMALDLVGVEWSDDHPLNSTNTQAAEFRRLFAPLTPKEAP